MARSTVIQIRVSEGEKAHILGCAERAGESVSEYLRKTAMAVDVVPASGVEAGSGESRRGPGRVAKGPVQRADAPSAPPERQQDEQNVLRARRAESARETLRRAEEATGGPSVGEWRCPLPVCRQTAAGPGQCQVHRLDLVPVRL